MDQIENKILPSLTETITSSNFLKRATKFLISISLCSFLFSSYSSWYSSFFHSMNNSQSTFPFSIDKNYVFLIFNGILVFIAKTSGSFHFNSNDNRSVKNVENGLQIATESVNFEREITEDHDDTCYNLMEEGEGIRLSDHEYLKEEQNHEEQEGKSGKLFDNDQQGDEEQEGKSGKLFDDDQQGDEEQEGKSGKLFDDDQKDEEQHERSFMDESRENEIESQVGDDRLYDDDDEEEDGRLEEKEINNIGVLSTEELNKKFDEFIRRMKEEIRIEAQRTLIMV